MCYQLTPLQSRHRGFVSPLQFRLGRKVGACPGGLHAPCALHPPSMQARLLSGPALWCAWAHLRGPFSTSWAEVPKGPVRSLSSWGGVGTLPCQLRSLHAPWLGPGRLGPGETRARLAQSVCPPGRVASVCLGCWLLPAQARGLDALYGEPSAAQGPMLALGPPPCSAPAARRPEAPQRPQAEADVSVVSSPVYSRAEAWAGLASALSTVLVSHRKTLAACPPHTGEGAVPLNVRRGHVRSTGREGDAGPPAKLRMGPSRPAGWRGGQEPRASQNS